jgi:GTP-binding protein EngB required for normal cell division
MLMMMLRRGRGGGRGGLDVTSSIISFRIMHRLLSTTTASTWRQRLPAQLLETLSSSLLCRRRAGDGVDTFCGATLSSATTTTTSRFFSAMCIFRPAVAVGSGFSSHNNNNNNNTLLQQQDYARQTPLLQQQQHQKQQSRGLAWNKKWKQKAPRKKPMKLHQHNMMMRGDSSGGGGGHFGKKTLHKKHHHQEDDLSPLPDNIHQQQQQQQGTILDATSMSSMFIPPAVLLPTGSPHVFVAAIAAHDAGITDPQRQLFPSTTTSSSNNNDDDDNNVHTTTTTTSAHRRLPPLFRQASFEYFSPIALKYELPGSRRRSNSIGIPEVAFLGRSNVGKSSLINALMGRDLARISKQPGRTQFVHYFGLVPHSVLAQQKQRALASTGATASSSSSSTTTSAGLVLDPSQCHGFFVDLPGYGYAVAPDDKVNDWQTKTQMFLTSRIASGNLRRLYLLLDARHGASTFDQSIMVWLEEAAIPYTIVYTKADRVGKPTIVKHVNQTCLRYHHLHVQRQEAQEERDNNDDDDNNNELCMSPIIHVTSSKAGTSSGLGLRELLENIEAEFLLVPSK